LNSLLNAAIWYAQNGFPVFPLSPGSKIPMQGSRGFLDATTELEQIKAWWTSHPNANIGLATAGLCVIDFDVTDGELAAWSKGEGVQAAILSSPMRQQTPSGGLHVVLKQPEGAGWRISASVLAADVDVRADGGYIVAAPSQVDGLDYEWTEGPVPAGDLPEPPKWLADRIASLSKKSPGKTGNLEGTWDNWQGEKISHGSRHQALLSWAGLLRSWGMSGAEIEAALLAVNEQRCDPPSPEKEVRRIARDYARKAVEEAKARAAGMDGSFSLPALDAKLSASVGAPDEVEDPGPVPAELLLQIPGFVADVIEYSMGTAPYPNAVLSWVGAMCLQSFLAARKVEFEGIASNVYLLGLALSGGGKEHPRKINGQILTQLGLASSMGDRFASGEGLEDALAESPAMLFQTDEIDGMLEASTGTETRYRGIRDMILSLYGESSGVHVGRRKAGKQEPMVIQHPSLTLFGTAIPEHCYGAMNEDMVTKGLLSRMLILDSVRGERQPYRKIDLPETILKRAAWWRDLNPSGGNLALTSRPDPLPVDATESACVLFANEEQKQDEIYRMAQAKGDNVACGMCSRVMLQAKKLALIWAASTWDGTGRPTVTLEAAEWALAIVDHLGKRTLAMFARNAKSSVDFERRADKLIGYVVKNGGVVPHRPLTRYMKLTKREFDALIETLVDRGRIEVGASTATSGRDVRVYQVTE
jgi:hypothetical protein